MDLNKSGFPGSSNYPTAYQPVQPPPPSYSVGPSYPPPPPPPGIAPPQPQIIALGPTSFGPYPQNAICPSCNETVNTLTQKKTGICAWLASAGCCLFGCIFGCCLIPFYTDFTLDVEHSCPKCGRQLGLHRRI